MMDVGISDTVGRIASAHVDELERRVNALTLASTALWALLKERTDLTEEDLLARMRDLDLADGCEDSKITKQVLRCPACDRVMNPRHKQCLYCGAANLKLEAFDGAL